MKNMNTKSYIYVAVISFFIKKRTLSIVEWKVTVGNRRTLIGCHVTFFTRSLLVHPLG